MPALTATDKTELYRFFAIAFNAAPGVTYMNQLSEAVIAGMKVPQIVEVFTSKPQFTAVYPSFLTNAEFATKMVANVVGASASDAAKSEAVADITGALNAGWSRGKVIYQIFTNLASLTSDAKWGGTATQLNNEVAYARYYTETLLRDTTDLPTLQAVISGVTATSATTAAAIEAALNPGGQTYALTNGVDAATANIFNAVPVYTPAGNAFVNSLQDEDVLTGTGSNPTLNVSLGTPNDKAEALIVPTLNGIETVNVIVAAGTADTLTNNTGQGIGFQDASSLKALNITRLTANTASTTMSDLPAGTTELSVSNSTSTGAVTFTYREEVLTGAAESLALNLKSARMSSLTLGEVGTGVGDTGFFFETVNITTSGVVDIDTVTIGANGQEDLAAKRTADTTKQVINLTVASGSAELNTVSAAGADTININATGSLVVAVNANANVSTTANGLDATDLEALTITGAGNVRLDAVEMQASTATSGSRVINGSAMTGDLRLGVVAATAADTRLVVTSGSGNDEIRLGGDLSGSVSTGAGKDTVGGGTGFVTPALAGTASVSTGEGDDTVVVGALSAFGDTVASATVNSLGQKVASVDVGAGDDTVTVGALANAVKYSIGVADDAQKDDTYFLIGTSVLGGAGNDKMTIGATVAEGVLVDAGAGNDTVTIEQTGVTILAADTDANRVLTATGVLGLAVANREVTATDATKLDALGAIVEMGDGDDTISLTDTTSLVNEASTIVGTDAELRGGAGDDALNVTALDATTVTVATSYTSATVNDVNANVTGIEKASFTIANQITNANDTDAATATVNEGYEGSPTINDNNSAGASITADMLRFDSALKSVSLDSQEKAMLVSASQTYEVGTATAFTLNNLGAGVVVSLKAQEATGVSAGALKDDTTTDVTVTLNAAATAARGKADALTFNLTSGSGSFDLALNGGPSATDTVLNATSTTDDDNMLIEKLTIGLATDDKGHAIALTGFGDASYTVATGAYTKNSGTFTQWRNTAGNQDGAASTYNALKTDQKQAFGQGNDAATEFTLGSADAGTVAGTTTVLTGLSADKITLNGAGVVNMTVDATNNYTIVSGTGADVFNMVADTVDDEDAIDGGATGRNTLVINGTNNIGFATTNQPENDDAWTNKKNLQVLEIRANAAGANTNTVVLDEQTFVTGVDTINLTARTGLVGANQNTTLVFGDDFRRDTTITTTDDITSSVLTITNRVSAVETNQALTLFANGGAGLTLNDLYGRSKVAVTLTVNDLGGATTIASTATATTDGNVDLDIQAGTTGTVSSITLVDKNQAAGVLAAGTSLDTGAITVTVDNAWSKAAFSLNASAIDNAVVTGGTAAQTETALADGGLTFDGSAELDAALTVLGTGNSDTITGGAVADTLSGNDGNDSIVGGLGADTISGGAGKDTMLGGAGADSIDGGAGDDAITGGTGADILTGGAGVDTYSYSDVTESTGASSDTITDWAAGDKISITATVAGGSTVNLGRFSSSGDNTSLDQTSFDAYYGNGQLAIDVNGDGQINDNVDYAIKSASPIAIAATDINYTLTLGNGANLVRLGQGVDTITTGTGDDTFVLVGTITDAQAAAYATAGAGVVAGLTKVVPFGDLTTARITSDVTKGDSINGGTGTDTLHVYGAMDLATNVTLTSIETLVVHSDITLSPAQLASLGTLRFDGDSAHTLKIVQPATTVGGVTTPAKALTPAEVTTFLQGGQVAGVTTKLTTVVNVELTNSGANTTVAIGTSSTTSTTDIVKALPVQEFLFTSGIVTAASDLVVSLTGQSATYLNNTSNSLALYKDGGITGDLSFSTDLALASLNTLLNSVKVDNTKTSVLGTSGNDTIDLSGVTRGLTINGGLGNDTVTSTQGKDAINVSQGDETLVLTAATTGSVTLGATVNIATIDRVTGFGTGDTLQLPFVPSAVSGSTATGTVIGVIRGTASGDTFTVASTGADYLFVYDVDGAGAGTVLDAVVLVGYTPTVTGATGGTGSTGTFGG